MNQKSNLWVLLLLILLLVTAAVLLLRTLFTPLPAAPEKPTVPAVETPNANHSAAPATTMPQGTEASPGKAELIQRLKETFGQVFPDRDSTRLALLCISPVSGQQIARLHAQKMLQQRAADEPVSPRPRACWRMDGLTR